MASAGPQAVSRRVQQRCNVRTSHGFAAISIVPIVVVALVTWGVWLGPTAGATSTPTGLSAELAGPERSLPAHFLGFNGESFVLPADARLMTSNALQSKLAAIPGVIVRIPGGTPSQWIDWRNGQLIDAPGTPFASVSPDRPALTLRDWAKLVKGSHSTPLWDLNVLTSSLSDQLAMLRTAHALGLPVRYVELGNELWDPETPYVTRFPTGAAYGTAMDPWIVAIHRDFLGVSVAVSGADESDPQLDGEERGTRAGTRAFSRRSGARTRSPSTPTGHCPTGRHPAATSRGH